jgi:hypothetical protein
MQAIRCAKISLQSFHAGDCKDVELRTLCNEVPRTPPGPEGSNGTGSAECAAEIPKFLVFGVAEISPQPAGNGRLTLPTGSKFFRTNSFFADSMGGDFRSIFSAC